MSTTQTGFSQTLTRASLLPLCLFTAFVAYLVPGQLVFNRPAPAIERPEVSVVWKAAYSEKFPGCVSTVLWPAAESPVAVVVLTADGVAERVSSEEVQRRTAVGQADRMIGVCRIPQ